MRREPTRAYAGIGSRETPLDVRRLMTRLATKLSTLGLVCRTGGAEGADEAFELGAGHRVELYLPAPGFRGRAVCRLSRASSKAFEIAKAHHPKWPASPWSRRLLARNTHQILGPFCDEPSLFVLCWTPDGAERGDETSVLTGGTGQAIRVASAFGVPVLNLAREERRCAATSDLVALIAPYVPKTLPVAVV